jgi:hypothetical protein
MVLAGASGLVALLLLLPPPELDAGRKAGVATDAEAAVAIPTTTPWFGPRAERSLDLYTGPSSEYVVLGVVPRGAKLEVVGVSTDGDWLAVSIAPGSALYAWLPLDHIENPPDPDSLPVKPVRLIPRPGD